MEGMGSNGEIFRKGESRRECGEDSPPVRRGRGSERGAASCLTAAVRSRFLRA